MSTHKRLDQILQAKGQVSERQIREALIKQGVLGGRLGEHLIKKGEVGEADLVDALSEQYGLPGVCLEGRAVDPELFARIPFAVAEQHRCVPFAYDATDDMLEVAFANPHDRVALHAVSKAVHPTSIRPFVAAAVHVQSVLAGHRRASGKDSHYADQTDQTDCLLDLLELAVAFGQEKSAHVKVTSAWVSKLATDIASRLNVPVNEQRRLRLAALLSDIADWRRSVPGRSRSEVVRRSIAVLRDLDLPWDTLPLLEVCTRSQRPDHEGDLSESILRVAWAAADTMADGGDDAMLDQWRSRLTEDGGDLDEEVVTTACLVLRVRSLRRRLGDHPPEIVVIGHGPFADDLLDTLREMRYRVAQAHYWAEGITLLERRCPDLVCVVASDLGIPPRYVMEGQITEHGIDPGSVIWVGPEETADRSRQAAHDEGAVLLSEASGIAGVLGRIRDILQASESAATAQGVRRHGAPSDASVEGLLADLGLPDLVQVLSSAHKTAHVVLTRERAKGSLWFDRGQIASARTDDLSGEDAFFDLLHWSDGRFAVHTAERVPDRNVTTQTTALLLEGFRRMDESNRTTSA